MSATTPTSFVMVGREMLALDVYAPDTADADEPTIFFSSSSSELYDFTPSEARELAGLLVSAADAAEAR